MTFRILSLDGGGSWALIEVQTLIRLYGAERTGHDVLRNFDCVAATSAGSLVLAGMVENLTLNQIADYFFDRDKRLALFQPTSKPLESVLSRLLGIGPKYSTAKKLPAIETLLPKTGKKPMEYIVETILGPNGKPVHLLIVGFDYDKNRAVFFRSAPATRAGWGTGQSATVTLAEAVHASTNAPVNYFDAPADLPSDPDRFWDGGITGCNNPSLAAITEALVLGQSARDIHLLSLGTGAVSLPLADAGAPSSVFKTDRQTPGLVKDLTKLATAILDDPPDAATYIAHAITGGSDGLTAPVESRVVRMSPLITPLPAADGDLEAPAGLTQDQFRHLCKIDLAALDQADIVAIKSYCSAWLNDSAPNQPIRANGKTFDPLHSEVGYPTFSAAFLAWQLLFSPLTTQTGRSTASAPSV